MRHLVVIVVIAVGLGVSFSFGGEGPKALGPEPIPLLELQAPKKRSMRSAAFLPDDRTLLTGGGDSFGPGDLRNWSTLTGQCMDLHTDHKLEIRTVAVSPDGHFAASGGGYGEVKLWDVATGRVLADLDAGTEFSNSVAFSSDGKLLASGGLDAARVWNVKSRQCVAELPDIQPLGYHRLTFSPDGKTLAVEENGGVLRRWDTVTWKEQPPIQSLFPRHKSGTWGQIGALSYSSDGKLLAVAGGYYEPREYSVKLWDVATGKVIREIKAHREAILGAKFTPDGEYLITCSSDQTIKIWEVASGKQIASWTAHKSLIRNLAISHSGKLLASCGDDDVVRIWDLASILGVK